MIKMPSLIILGVLGPFYFIFGQSIFLNDITGVDPSTDNPYITGQIFDANITVSGIGRSAPLNVSAAPTSNRYNARSWGVGLDLSKYFYFTITPNFGYEIDFASFIYTGQSSATGPTNIEIRSSLDGYVTGIGSPTISGATIDLSSITYQNLSSSITFRIYAFGASSGVGTFSINDFIFNGTVSAMQCPSTVTWNGTTWSTGSPPNTSTAAIINGNYSTATHGSFSACRLTVNSGFILTIDDATYIEVKNDVMVDGEIVVESKGAFVQNNDSSTVTVNGNITVEKQTPPLNAWYEYVYWSSPVSSETIGGGLSDSDARRRFSFLAQNYLDATKETNNNGAAVSGQDDVDDNNNDWQKVFAATPMVPGVGYASTHDEFIFNSTPGGTPKSIKYTFNGPFNNGTITVPVYRNDSELNDNNWNLIGNPYPSAIDADLFFSQNLYNASSNPTGTLEGSIYLWSHNAPPSSTNNGNQVLNFSASDYAIINGSGQVAGGDGVMPDRKIPSCQGFFVLYSNNGAVKNAAGNVKQGEVVFHNAMRKADVSSNALFFKSSAGKNVSSNTPNRLWVNLTSKNGVFSQTLVSYIDGATNNDDGPYYDTAKSAITGKSASVYSVIKDLNKKFAIQGKNTNSLNLEERIFVGFSTSIDVPTLYSMSIPQFEGAFLGANTIYLQDHLLNKVHNLSVSDYSFTSEIGEFNNRFEIVFSAEALGLNDNLTQSSNFRIVDLGNDEVQFTASNNLKILNVTIFDMLGRELYNFKGHNTTEVYNLSRLGNAVYISKVVLSNGAIIIKKAVKR